MSSHYSRKKHAAFLNSLILLQRFFACVVGMVLIILPVAPVLASEATVPAIQDPPQQVANEGPFEDADGVQSLETSEPTDVGSVQPSVPDPMEDATDVAEESDDGNETVSEVSTVPSEAASPSNAASEYGSNAVIPDAILQEEEDPALTAPSSVSTEEADLDTDAGSSTPALPYATSTPDLSVNDPALSLATATGAAGVPGGDVRDPLNGETGTNTPASGTTTASSTNYGTDGDLSPSESPSAGEDLLVNEDDAREQNGGYSESVNDMNRYQFSADQCVSMGGGSYYCADDDSRGKTNRADRVYAAADGDGDKELFLVTDDGETQITDNRTDDDAPFYDEVSQTVIWHRLVDGRYQIFAYDLANEEEQQLTFERFNSMQPSRHGDVAVWQSWIGNDWEVMLEEGDELAMLTDNATHDIAPYINGDYVIWQSFEDAVWKVKLYNMVTGLTDVIADADGGSVKNPRLVLVYDTKFENGDVETKGYDLMNGEVVPLTSSPGPLPEDLPDPDPVEEDRALIQTVTQLKPKTENDPEPGDDPLLGGNQHEPLASSDIVIPPFAEDVPTTTIEDVIVPQGDQTSATSTSHIEDVIIPPFQGVVSGSIDPQASIASST